MDRGIIYIMTTIVPGLIKIGKTGSTNYESRMYNLEHDGYRNVTGLKREFAIEVDNYNSKEKLLHTIFEKSQISDTELFAVDVEIAKQLLSSFEGDVIFPKTETKEEIFVEAAETENSKLIPNGEYTITRKKKSDTRTVFATAIVKDGTWTIKSGSVLGIMEDKGVPRKVQSKRCELMVDESGLLLEDAFLGECSPSFSGALVINQSCDGWENWKNKQGNPIKIYRKVNSFED